MRSSSGTTQSQQSTNTSNQLSLGDIENGNVVTGSGNTIVSYVPAVVDKALEYSAEGFGKAVQTVDNALQFAGGSYTKSVDSINKSQDNAYQFSAGLVQTAIGAVVNSVDGQRQSLDRTLEYSAGVTKLAFDSNDKARDSAFDFAAGAFQEATSTQNKALELNKQFAMETYNQIQESNLNAQAAVNAANNNAFSFSSGAFTKALDSTAVQSQSYAKSLTEFADKTIQTAVQSTKTESAQAIDKIIDLTGDTTKYIMYGVGALGLIFILFRSK